MKYTKKKPLTCAKCQDNVTKTQYKIQCANTCQGWFHKSCSGLTDSEFREYDLRKKDDKWSCPACSNVHASISGSESETETSHEHLPSNGKNIGETGTFENLFDHPNPSNRELMKAIKGMYEELKSSITFNGSMVEQMKESMKTLTDENKQLRKEHLQLQSRVVELEKEIIHGRSSSAGALQERNKNIVIVGLDGGENASTDVKKVLSLLNLDVTPNDYKLKILPSQHSRKPILVSFTHENTKNQVLEKRKLVTMDTDKCGINADVNRRIYINQDLSKHTRELLRKAAELRRAGFKYVWCKDDNILVRRADGGPVIRIITSAQVESLKNSQV